MDIGLLGNKIGMTQIFDQSGNIIPVTILKVGPCIVTQIKTTAKDGYNAILNVMVDRRTNKFVSAWRLSVEQIENLRRNGNIQ